MQILSRIKQITAAGILSGLAMVVAGCGQQPGGPPPGGSPEVAIVTIQPQRVTITTELSGRTSANLISEVRPQVGGIILKRLFTEGADVQAGQVLYQIDPATYQAALDNAKAALGRSEANLPAIRLKANRLRELLPDRAVSQQDYDDAAAAVKLTEADIQYWKAAVETARINLQHTTITAPISGRVGRSNITEGALVAAYQPLALATIQRLDPMYVDVPQSTTDLLNLRRRLGEDRLHQKGKVRSKVRLLLEDNTPYPWEGTLQFRDVTVDPTTGSVMLRVIFPNPQALLLPGMFVRAFVEEGVNAKALLVPQQAVSRDPKGNPVALIVNTKGLVEQRSLALDRAMGDAWLVSAGLAAGDRVIVEGMQKARPGASVRTVPFAGGGNKVGGDRKIASPAAAKSN